MMFFLSSYACPKPPKSKGLNFCKESLEDIAQYHRDNRAPDSKKPNTVSLEGSFPTITFAHEVREEPK